jgi:hypothetical protein
MTKHSENTESSNSTKPVLCNGLKLPKYVRLENDTVCFRLRGGFYYRDGGDWRIGYKIDENGVLRSKDFAGLPRQILNIPFVEVTEDEWRKSNGIYAPIKLYNSLRVGNLVYSSETQEIQKITGITEEHPFIDAITFDYLSYDEIYPIELKDNFIIKLGFINKENNSLESIYELNGVVISNSSKGFEFYFNGFSSKLKYVHELQNLYFALTQCELTVA